MEGQHTIQVTYYNTLQNWTKRRRNHSNRTIGRPIFANNATSIINIRLVLVLHLITSRFNIR